jgi:hypothetical protein
MAKKKPFVLRIDPASMQMLEKWAADEFRSLNGQIEWILHRALKEAGRYKPMGTEKKQAGHGNETGHGSETGHGDETRHGKGTGGDDGTEGSAEGGK